MKDYTGKVVAISGCASGIGKELAARLAAAGAKLSLLDYNADKLNEQVKEFEEKGYEFISVVADASDEEAVCKWAKNTVFHFGRVDYLFTNVGVNSHGKIWRIPPSEWKRIFEINLMSSVLAVHAFMPYFIAQNTECHIINTASMSGQSVSANIPAYAASKAALISMTESLSMQLQTYHPNIHAYVLNPGATRTDIMNSRYIGLMDLSDDYFQTEEYKKLNDMVTELVIGKYSISVEEAVDNFFDQFERGLFNIRTSPLEEPLVQYRVDRVLDQTKPIPFHLR